MVDHEPSTAETTPRCIRQPRKHAFGDMLIRKLQHRVDVIDKLWPRWIATLRVGEGQDRGGSVLPPSNIASSLPTRFEFCLKFSRGPGGGSGRHRRTPLPSPLLLAAYRQNGAHPARKLACGTCRLATYSSYSVGAGLAFNRMPGTTWGPRSMNSRRKRAVWCWMSTLPLPVRHGEPAGAAQLDTWGRRASQRARAGPDSRPDRFNECVPPVPAFATTHETRSQDAHRASACFTGATSETRAHPALARGKVVVLRDARSVGSPVIAGIRCGG
jgi:hypothetical protein